MNKQDVIFDDQSIIHRVDALLVDAIEQRASDIHLEQTKDCLRVRFRIDGILVDQKSFSLQLGPSIIVRLKIMANLNIAERRIPQDGKFQIKHHENDIDIRISTFPSLYGEKVVVRILNRLQQMITLDSLGFDAKMLEIFKQLMQKNNGFFLVTGATGSGKTTTLYAALSFLNTAEKNIVTLEDPIEYSLDGITQSQIHPVAGFTFEKGIRSLVRQDPDIIMVGEIRDKVTARIAIEAALTGHLVLSTMHTAHAVGAIMRLIDMGIEPFLITAALSGVLAQRLVRMLCNHCKEKRPTNKEETIVLREHGVDTDFVYIPQGCVECNNLGHKGRIAVFELLHISSKLRSLIIKNVSYDELYAQALKDGMKTLMSDGAHKVACGIISFEEFVTVIF